VSGVRKPSGEHRPLPRRCRGIAGVSPSATVVKSIADFNTSNPEAATAAGSAAKAAAAPKKVCTSLAFTLQCDRWESVAPPID
jgi:hypothetical protein